MAASYFCIQASDLPKKFNVSIQEIFDTKTYLSYNESTVHTPSWRFVTSEAKFGNAEPIVSLLSINQSRVTDILSPRKLSSL